MLSHVPLFETPWTAACQAPLSMEFSRQILEWTAIPFSRGSSWPSDGTRVSCIAGRFVTFWATREAPLHWGRLENGQVRVRRSLNLALRVRAQSTAPLITTMQDSGRHWGEGEAALQGLFTLAMRMCMLGFQSVIPAPSPSELPGNITNRNASSRAPPQTYWEKQQAEPSNLCLNKPSKRLRHSKAWEPLHCLI